MWGAIDDELRTQLSDRLRVILQAINSFASGGISQTSRAQQEKRAIIQHIRQEQDFLDGIEQVYRALIHR